MSQPSHADELAWEQNVNERYLRRADAASDDAGRGPDAVAAPANTGWTGSGPKKPFSQLRSEALVGRVALIVDDEDLGSSFYVGGGFVRLQGGIIVVSWAADVARLFYDGRAARLRSPDAPDPRRVAACRSFKSEMDRLVDFEDEFEHGTDRDSAFARPSGLEIARPPGAAAPKPAGPVKPSDSRRSHPPADQPERRARADGAEAPPPSGPPPGMGRQIDRHAPAERPRASAAPTERDQRRAEQQPGRPPSSAASRGDEPGVQQPEEPSPRPRTPGVGTRRAERLLHEAIEAPKTGPLAPVLSTLQPEQYRLVTWPSEQNLAVQGHPGTGKTIVAAHRAAYLVLPKDHDGEGPRLSRVALVGPTDLWKAHIGPAVARLVVEGVEVLSLESLIREWSHGLPHPLHRPNEREFHSLWAIGRIVESADRDQKRRLLQIRRGGGVRELVNSLVQDTGIHRRFVPREDADLSRWLLAAGDYRNARRDPSYLLFLAAAGVATGQMQSAHGDHQHIVVDEAQDLRPVEWWMLSKMFRAGADERWSVFGDMNQRRSDFTWESWESLADLLQFSAEDGEQSPRPEVLDCGYRSTREILDYAGALLPRGGRTHHALRGGLVPSVRQVGPKRVAGVATEEAERLTVRYHQGSVAVIAYGRQAVDEIERSLTRRRWRKDREGGGSLRLDRRGCRLSVIQPVEARGLEFDAVVVVEPADFKPNLGRHGELYTSLTRANQELVVVHSQAIPRELRGRGARTRG